jgi:two-component system sensor histidine kinase YesM
VNDQGETMRSQWKDLFNIKTIRGKFFVLTTALTVIPMLVLSMLFYYIAADKLVRNAEVHALSSLQMGQHYMSKVMEDLSDLTNVILSNTQLQEILAQGTEDDYEYLRNIEKVGVIMMTIIQSKSYINTYLIYNQKGDPDKRYYRGSSTAGTVISNTLIPESARLWNKMLTEKGATLWINTAQFSDPMLNEMLVGKRLKRTDEDYEDLGFVMLELDKSKFFQGLTFLNPSKHSQIYVLDENNQIIYHLPEDEPVQAGMAENFLSQINGTESSGSREIVVDDKKYIGSFVTDRKYGWKIAAIVESDKLFQDANSIRESTILVFLILLLLGWLLAFWMGDTISRPLKRLRALMAPTREVGPASRQYFNPEDEVGQIGYRYIDLNEEKQRLDNQVYDALVKRKEAEIQALQAQINPHFLYNTLESLNWLAISRGQTEISDVVGSLGKFFRHTINRGNGLVTAAEELEHVKSYVMVQNFRYKDKFDFIAELDPVVMSLFVPRFVLQPVVENAIYHGLKPKEGKGSIMVSGETEEGKLVFRITDDGVGISANRLAEIAESLQDDVPEARPIPKMYGLRNIHDRLRLRFGEGFGVSIRSEHGSYTTISLTIPIILSPEEGSER